MSNPNIQNQDISVNNENQGTIESCPYDAEIPFAQIPNELIRSREISPECGHLIINLLSNKPGWRINVAQLVLRYEGFWGRDKVYKLMNEAIKSGYIKKEETRSKNKFGSIKYYVSRTPKFKESFTLPGFQDTDFQLPENTHYKKNDKEERSSYVDKKNDNVSVHNSKPKKTPTATVHRSSCTHDPIVSSPAASTVPFDPAKFKPKTYEMPNGARLSAKCANAFAKYKGEDKVKLYANLAYFEQTYKPTILNPEAYLQSCIKNNYAEKEMDKYRNWLYATYIIQDNNLTGFEVMKTVVKKKGKAGDSISLSIQSDRFAELLHDFIGLERVNHVA